MFIRSLTTARQTVYKWCMAGYVRTKEKCPRCGGKFAGEPLRCQACYTQPSRLYLDLPWHGQKIKLYSDQDGYPLDSYDRAARLLSHVRYEIDRGLFDPKNYVKRDVRGLLLENYLAAWLDRKTLEAERGQLSRSYLHSVKVYLRRYILPGFRGRNIREVTEGHLEDFKNGLPPGLSGKTVKNIMGILHKVFADTLKRRNIARAPAFPSVQTNEPVIRWLSREDQAAVLAQIADPVRRGLFLFLMRTGCRPGEARALQWEDINWKRETVTIRAAMDREEFRPYTKERDVRILPLHPEVLAALRALPRALAGFVFSRQGRPLTQKIVQDTWRRAARRAGFDIGCYQGTKHSLGCQLINEGIREEVLQALFGHKDRKSTKRYAKLVSDSLKYWKED